MEELYGEEKEGEKSIEESQLSEELDGTEDEEDEKEDKEKYNGFDEDEGFNYSEEEGVEAISNTEWSKDLSEDSATDSFDDVDKVF